MESEEGVKCDKQVLKSKQEMGICYRKCACVCVLRRKKDTREAGSGCVMEKDLNRQQAATAGGFALVIQKGKPKRQEK